MMQPQLLPPFWPSSSYNIEYSTLPRTSHSSLVTTDPFEIPLDSDFSTMFLDLFTEFPNLEGDVAMDDNDVCKWLNITDTDISPLSWTCSLNKVTPDLTTWSSPSLSVVSTEASTAIFGGDDRMELDTQLSLHHLLVAYAEAKENGHEELADVIVKRVKGKANNPLGETILERVAYNLFDKSTEDQESSKNFEQAFRAFYQILPFGRFAHFAANSAILEALPNDAEKTLHIIDFDMGEGIQWPPLLEAMAQQKRAVRLTSIKTKNQWRFEETKRRLYDHTTPFGLKLQIEEMTLKELVIETKRVTKKEWLAFNCMFRLPHMTKNMQKTTQAIEFLKTAKELLAYPQTPSGIINFANDESEGFNTYTSSSYTSFLNRKLEHYKSLFESMEWHFPANLTEARIALESIFLAPYINSESWYHEWEQNKNRGKFDVEGETGLQRQRVSKENLVEAKEVVREMESPYRVIIEEQKQNEMVLEWKGTPLIRVSTWL